MAEEKYEPRDIGAWFRQWMPWTLLFRGFWVALDHKKLLLAAAGILVMATGWVVISTVCFGARQRPIWPTHYDSARYPGTTEKDRVEVSWKDFTRDRKSWNLFYWAAG